MPEGKARSSRNALKHGLRARTFLLPPGDDPITFGGFAEGIRQAYGPEDQAEAELVSAIAAGLWQAMRTDRLEAEVLAAIPPVQEGHGHGSQLIDKPEHRASLTTVLRYQTTAGNAVRRALDCFLKHRKARRDGLIVEEGDGTAGRFHPNPLPLADESAMRMHPANNNEPAPIRTNEFTAPANNDTAAPTSRLDLSEPNDPSVPDCTNEFPATPKSLPATASPISAEPGIVWPADAPPDLFPPDTPPHVQAFILGLLEGRSQEEREHFYALSSIEAFEAGQLEPEKCKVSEEELALVRWVTRHNPPWCYGPKPGKVVERPACLGLEPVLPAKDVRPDPRQVEAKLRARLVSLLDRNAPKDLSDLDLAHAVCAVLWPKYPEYRGVIHLFMLRRVLQEVRVDGRTLQWLDSHELAGLCQEWEAGKATGSDG